MEKKKAVYNLTLCAVMAALGTVLSLVKVWQMPLGGSITLLSMLPAVLVSCMKGVKWGVITAFVHSLIQLGLGIATEGVLGWGLTPASLAGTIILDYILAFTVLGFAGAFRKKGYAGMILGTATVIVARFICHLISGVIIFDIWCEWSNVWLYSICYNGTFMLPELVLTVAAAAVLLRLPQIKRLIY